MAESAFHRPRKITLVEGVVEQIVTQIANGTLKPGDRLPSERQLIETLQIGRSSVREALQGLAVMGFVEIRPGHGTYVTLHADALAPTRDTSETTRQRQLDMRLAHIEARGLIETETARLAAVNGDRADIERLTVAWEAYRDIVTRKQSLEAATEAHAAFHITIAHIGGNPFYPTLLSDLLRSVPPSLRRSEIMRPEAAGFTMAQLIEREIDIHGEIHRAITAQDAEASIAAVDAHMALERHLVTHILARHSEDS